MTSYALIDCNNFYASCERLFDPALADRPLVVLSNNDGCVIARCPLARALGIPMGVPFFQIKSLAGKHNVAVRSSNFELYGDMSRRVMQVLSRFSPGMEVYSIDEAFLAFDRSCPVAKPDLARDIRSTILRWVGIPVSVGFGPTKTLAKAANWMAKRTPSGVWLVDREADRRALLAAMPVNEVWGIGRNLSRRLSELGIKTAADFVERLEARQVRRAFTVTGWQTWRELAGQPCLNLEQAPPAKKSICTSRSFATGQTSLSGIEAAVAGHAVVCAEKLRRHRLAASMMQVFLATNRFRDDQHQSFPVGQCAFDPPSQDSLEISAAAGMIARELFSPGCSYKKAGVVMSGLQSAAAIQGNLFDPVGNRSRRLELMRGIDALHARYGRCAVTPATRLVAPESGGRMRKSARSPRYTTRWDEIIQVS